MKTSSDTTPNRLAHSSSPYLLQHAHNPVDWFPWCDEALQKAKEENKLLLISIGYSACHWCHVMERECFEDDEVAKIMNEHYVCIKVDREERPDIDQVYMSAVQLMTGRGGWPLNCIALPDGRPIYGGTYFPKHHWIEVLRQVNALFKNDRQKAEEYAEQLLQAIRGAELVSANTGTPSFSVEEAKAVYMSWKKYFDEKEGGPNRYPKFPLPNNYEFFHRYYHLTKDKSALDHTLLTLNKMAFGGIYDHIGGGFARYSTDELWKVPHFEKMLYDNAQLVSLYSAAYSLTKDPLYKKVVYETLEFVERELTSPEGGFYSALDADSEGEEGKYYVWKKEELEKVIPAEKLALFYDYFNVNETGLWEENNYILLRKQSDESIAEKHNIQTAALQTFISNIKKALLQERSKRIRPGLDDKQLVSWNALVIKGYSDAHRVFGEKRFLEAAQKNANLILSKIKKKDGGLFHSYKNGTASINGYLEDYSFTIEAFIGLYESTFDIQWLSEAESLLQYALRHFRDPVSGMFYFTSVEDPPLIVRKMEIHDNVIPASNSSIAKGLFLLGKFFCKQEYIRMAEQMLSNVKNDMPRYGSSWSNWGILLINFAGPFYELIIAGSDAEKYRKEINSMFMPNKIVAGFSIPSESTNLSLFKNRYVEGKTLVYPCENNTCRLPVETANEILKLF